MKRTFLFVGLAIAITAGTALELRANAAPDDRTQIDALYQRFTTAFRHKDLDAIMSVYVPGQSLFVFDITPPRQHVGWNDYRADWRDFFAMIKGSPTFSISDLGVTISGDVAYSHSLQHVAAKLAKGGSLTVNVRETDVLRKIDGEWLIVQEHASLPVDLDTMKPDLLSKP